MPKHNPMAPKKKPYIKRKPRLSVNQQNQKGKNANEEKRQTNKRSWSSSSSASARSSTPPSPVRVTFVCSSSDSSPPRFTERDLARKFETLSSSSHSSSSGISTSKHRRTPQTYSLQDKNKEILATWKNKKAGPSTSKGAKINTYGAKVSQFTTSTSNVVRTTSTTGTAIATKSTAIATKSTAIATKSTAIATKSTAIATKSTAIATKSTAIATKSTAIATKSTAIASTSTAIYRPKSKLETGLPMCKESSELFAAIMAMPAPEPSNLSPRSRELRSIQNDILYDTLLEQFHEDKRKEEERKDRELMQKALQQPFLYRRKRNDEGFTTRSCSNSMERNFDVQDELKVRKANHLEIIEKFKSTQNPTNIVEPDNAPKSCKVCDENLNTTEIGKAPCGHLFCLLCKGFIASTTHFCSWEKFNDVDYYHVSN